MDASSNIYLHRWGDAPIQTVTLKLFDARVALIQVDYSHGSTRNEIKDGKEVEARPVQDATPTTLNDAQKQARAARTQTSQKGKTQELGKRRTSASSATAGSRKGQGPQFPGPNAPLYAIP